MNRRGFFGALAALLASRACPSPQFTPPVYATRILPGTVASMPIRAEYYRLMFEGGAFTRNQCRSDFAILGEPIPKWLEA